MKNILLLIFLITFQIGNALAHALWLETNPNGQKCKKQQVHVYFGEYSYGIKEKPGEEAFEKVKNFKLWLVDPKGKKTELTTSATDSCFTAFFTPEKDGLYTIILDNNEIEVIDFTKYNFGIFKTHYHSVAKVLVGKSRENSTFSENPDGISLVDKSENAGETSIQVLYKGEPLAESEVEICLPDQWKKELKTDAEGMISFKTPWKATYLVEATIKEEVPGKYKDQDYEFVWHCGTYAINAK